MIASLFFQRKIAGLIISGKYERARREIQKFNSKEDDNNKHLRLLPLQEALIWARKTLAEKGASKPTTVESTHNGTEVLQD